MFDVLYNYIAKPILGLTIVIRLFGGGGHGDDENPSVDSLKFEHAADSVFVQADIRNGLTPQIKDLLEGGVVVKTTCTFSCGAFSKQWERKLQYNPVKRCASALFSDGSCDSIFEKESLACSFNRIHFYLADLASVGKMRSAPAKLRISTSTTIDAMAIGEKKLWPEGIVADFNVPELPMRK
jgi:hypothetical protein